MGGEIRIGTSGWEYRHWRGDFYPTGLPRDRWLDFYAERFETVELNNPGGRGQAEPQAHWHRICLWAVVNRSHDGGGVTSMAANLHQASSSPPETPMEADRRTASTRPSKARSRPREGDWLDTDGETFELLAHDEGWPRPYGAASRGAP